MSIVDFASRILIGNCSSLLYGLGLIDDFVHHSGLNLGRLNHDCFVGSLIFIVHHKLVESTIAVASLLDFLSTIKVLLRKPIVIYPWNPSTIATSLLTSLLLLPTGHVSIVLVDVYVLVVGAGLGLGCVCLLLMLVSSVIHYT